MLHSASLTTDLMITGNDERCVAIDTLLLSCASAGRVGLVDHRRLDTGTGLYQMMPLNARLGLKEILRGFTGGPEVQMVDRKHDTDPLRFEQQTPGYTLVNFNAGYHWRHLRFEGGGTDLLNHWYYLPLGGVNFDDFQASGWMGQILPLTGPGRSFHVGVSVPF